MIVIVSFIDPTESPGATIDQREGYRELGGGGGA